MKVVKNERWAHEKWTKTFYFIFLIKKDIRNDFQNVVNLIGKVDRYRNDFTMFIKCLTGDSIRFSISISFYFDPSVFIIDFAPESHQPARNASRQFSINILFNVLMVDAAKQ